MKVQERRDLEVLLVLLKEMPLPVKVFIEHKLVFVPSSSRINCFLQIAHIPPDLSHKSKFSPADNGFLGLAN
ncbi:hypothetical protein J7E73_23960 [Paenibacillus albidus]|uniref:hypothetical protein n=1 Tax=Paenibacillus albidus TaxID=2041023 RepID=UPI001BE583C3|nr:hypothetical protein [Paenibacillus albidus]MBT2292133.1 hypothetical protein [Paenibacillus albidus]